MVQNFGQRLIAFIHHIINNTGWIDEAAVALVLDGPMASPAAA